MPLYMKLPIRGFSNARFRREYHVINLEQLNDVFEDGDTVSLETLRQHGFVSGPSHGVKLLEQASYEESDNSCSSISDSAVKS